MKYTLMGRGVYALGGDIAATERIGFNLNRVRLFIYMLAGGIGGLAGGIGVSNIQVANPYDFQGR
jgi:simple sugar transport system permease protein